MPVRIRIPDHMLMPFGCKKFDMQGVGFWGVSTDGTYLVSQTQCVHIDMADPRPLCLSGFLEYFPNGLKDFPIYDDPLESLRFILQHLRDNCELDTEYERKFLILYLQVVHKRVEHSRTMISANAIEDDARRMAAVETAKQRYFLAPMPFPQAHIYARNPLSPGSEARFNPDKMFKVDFAFWVDRGLVAVEIDGGSHIGSRAHIEKDRMLSRCGVPVVHIMNNEIDEYGEDVVSLLLPPSIPGFDVDREMDSPILNPLDSRNRVEWI